MLKRKQPSVLRVPGVFFKLVYLAYRSLNMRFLRLAVALCALERVRSATTLTYENPVYAQDHPDPGVLWDPASEVSDRRRDVLGGGGAPW